MCSNRAADFERLVQALLSPTALGGAVSLPFPQSPDEKLDFSDLVVKVSLIDPSIVSALARCGAVAISDDSSDDDYLRWIDGFNMHDPCRPAYQKPWAKIGGNGFRGCRRDQFLEELAKELPADKVHFRKRVETLEEAADGSIKMVFADGETAEADAGECGELSLSTSRDRHNCT
jgi:hypothetical protein